MRTQNLRITSYGWNPERDGITPEAKAAICLLIKLPGHDDEEFLEIAFSINLEEARYLIASLEDSLVEAETGERPSHPCKKLPPGY